MTFYRAATDNVSDHDPVYSGVRATLVAIGGQLAQLAEIRNEAYSHDTGISQTVSEYDGLVTSLLNEVQERQAGS